MQGSYAVVDLFAGPGGLAEGFSSFRSSDAARPFNIVLSIEKERAAHSTLLLRSFLRQFDRNFPKEYYDFLNNDTAEPDWKSIYPDQWSAACAEAQCLTLGDELSDEFLQNRLPEIRNNHGDDTIVIGGPPCQAYSLVGRARHSGSTTYVAKADIICIKPILTCWTVFVQPLSSWKTSRACFHRQSMACPCSTKFLTI
jgi:DNA (cytosine-5)-methyltransferase 1